MKFFYNERGQRIKKESYSTTAFVLQNTTFYQLDLSGNTMAIYNMPSGAGITQVELPIYGLDRIGIYKKASGIASYEIKDHLGNVRAIIEKESGSPVIKSFADYYPFGELLPSRNSLNYRYAFQGQELDGETGMEAFQLRLWDGRLGRWLSPDPYGQYDSPYLGMGNNPISMIDPDGGFTEGPGDGIWAMLTNWFKSESTINGGELNEVTVQGKSGSSSNFFTNFFDWNPHNTIATENRNFLFGWWNSNETKNYISRLQEARSGMEYIPRADAYFSLVADKSPGIATVQLGANFIPFSKLATPLKHKIPKVVIKGMTKVLSGEAEPILKNGVVEVLSEGIGKDPKKWLGAIHFRIEDVPGTSMNGSRILVKEVNVQKVYGYIKGHNYEDVFEISTSTGLVWP